MLIFAFLGVRYEDETWLVVPPREESSEDLKMPEPSSITEYTVIPRGAFSITFMRISTFIQFMP